MIGYADGLKCSDEARQHLELYIDTLTEAGQVQQNDDTHGNDKENDDTDTRPVKKKRGRKRKACIGEESENQPSSSQTVDDMKESVNSNSKRQEKRMKIISDEVTSVAKSVDIETSVDLAEVDTSQGTKGSAFTSPDISPSFRSGEMSLLL